MLKIKQSIAYVLHSLSDATNKGLNVMESAQGQRHRTEVGAIERGMAHSPNDPGRTG